MTGYLVTRNIDVAAVEAAITPRTRAVVPTHWPGSAMDLDGLIALAKRRGLRVIEDAALTFGTRFGGRKQLAELDGRPLLEHALEAIR